MSYTVYLKRSAEKELDRLPAKVYNRIIKRIISLGNNPRPPGVKNYLVKKHIGLEWAITESFM